MMCTYTTMFGVKMFAITSNITMYGKVSTDISRIRNTCRSPS